MIESIYKIGRSAQGGSEGRKLFLESLALEAPKSKKGNPTIAILKLNLDRQKFNIEVRELGEREDNSTARYLWLGNAAGANSDQDRVTTDSLGYLVTQTVPNLLRRLPSETLLYKRLQALFDQLYLDLGEPDELGVRGGGTYRRYRKFWNLEMLGVEGMSADIVREHVRETGAAKDVAALVSGALRTHFGSQLGFDPMLFTLAFGDELVVDNEAYQEYLENVLVDTVFEDAPHGRCHLTGLEGPVTSNMTRFGFKYYITDKLGFAAGARSEGFRATMGLSKEAYKSLLVGERFVRRRLGFYLAGTNGYLLPDVYTQETPTGFSGNLDGTLKAIKSRADLDLGIQEEVDEEVEAMVGEGAGYALNLLFYRQNKANFKVLRLIQDVPLYRLDELRRRASEVSRRIGGALFGESKQWDLTLKNIYYLLPVRKSGTNVLSKPVLEFYATLITGGLVDRRELVDGFVELVNVHRFGNHAAYHISEPADADYALIRYVAHSNLLLAFLGELDQLKEENMQNDYLERLDLTDDQHDYLTRLGYGEEQTALYLLGTLIGEIGNAQYRLGPNGKGGEKTILNKINYGGMTVARVQRLATEVFEKLTQYRDNNRRPLLKGRNEKMFAQAQDLLTQFSQDWRLNATENVYYLLSGYSHTTLQAMRSGKLPEQAGETINAEGEQA